MTFLPTPDIRIVHTVHATTVLTTSVATTVLTIVGGTVGGVVGGILVSRCKTKRPHRPGPMNGPPVDPLEDEHIRRVAHQWAVAHNSAEHEQRLVNKLRLMRRLQQERRWHRGWPL
jgi:hypothetical protein